MKQSSNRRLGAVGGLVLAACAVFAVAATAGQVATSTGPTYKKVGSWGKQGTGNGQFRGNAFGITVAKSGDVFVADSDNRRVQVFSAKGAFKRSYPFQADEVPQDVATDASGVAWAAINQAADARELGGSGRTIATGQAWGIAVDADGNVWAASKAGNTSKVARYDKASEYAQGKALGGFSDPADVEVSPDGSLYVVDGLTVKRFVDGKLVKTIRGGASKPIGIGVDLDCNLWVTNIAQRNLTRVSPSGKVLGTATSDNLIAQDVAVGPTGDLYAYDSGTYSVIRFSEDRSKPQAAAVAGAVSVAAGKATVKYTLTGVSCPAEVTAVASLKGAVNGKAAVKVRAGKPTVLSIPAKGASGKATFTIVLKTSGRPTTQTAAVNVTVK